MPTNNVSVGDPVQYLPTNGADEQAALVVGVDADERTVTLVTWDTYGKTWVEYEGVKFNEDAGDAEPYWQFSFPT